MAVEWAGHQNKQHYHLKNMVVFFLKKCITVNAQSYIIFCLSNVNIWTSKIISECVPSAVLQIPSLKADRSMEH